MDLTNNVLGKLGVLSVATRGAAGAGEVLITVNGSTEGYLAWSETPLAKGTRVVVLAERGVRTVDVASSDDSGFPLFGSP
jgi:hypothetical protein